MLLNLAVALLLMMGTTVIHAGGMILTERGIRHHALQSKDRLRFPQLFWVSYVIQVMFLVAVLEVMVWAAAYVMLGAVDGFEKAAYFSMVTFTTLGYGEIVLDENWRLLASCQAATGIIMFGWTTAIVIAAVQRAYFPGK